MNKLHILLAALLFCSPPGFGAALVTPEPALASMSNGTGNGTITSTKATGKLVSGMVTGTGNTRDEAEEAAKKKLPDSTGKINWKTFSPTHYEDPVTKKRKCDISYSYNEKS